MKRAVAFLLVATLFSFSALRAVEPNNPASVVEYVFTESELRDFLTENIQEAVEKAVAETTRTHLVKEIQLQADLDEEIVIRKDFENKYQAVVSDHKYDVWKGVGLTAGGIVIGSLLGFIAGVLH